MLLGAELRRLAFLLMAAYGRCDLLRSALGGAEVERLAEPQPEERGEGMQPMGGEGVQPVHGALYPYGCALAAGAVARAGSSLRHTSQRRTTSQQRTSAVVTSFSAGGAGSGGAGPPCNLPCNLPHRESEFGQLATSPHISPRLADFEQLATRITGIYIYIATRIAGA